MLFCFPVDFILRNKRTPDVFLVRRLLKRQLPKACPYTNKDTGRNVLLTPYPCSRPWQVYLASAWGGSGGPHPRDRFPVSPFLCSSVHLQYDGGLRLSPLTSGGRGSLGGTPPGAAVWGGGSLD